MADAAVLKKTKWIADPIHSQVGFKVRHMGFTHVRGEFKDFEVVVDFDGEDLSSLGVQVDIDASSIDTGETDRDNHLRSPDFLNVDEQPKITFRSTDITRKDDDNFILHGDLTINGITKRLDVAGQFHGQVTDPWGNQRVAFDGEATVNRKDFELTWNKVLEAGRLLVGEDVNISFEVQAVQAESDE